ncbi:hypothetical protein EJ357_05480 [Streptomyces cyaneochromogenes]|uniref:Twin-arginine translocation signal domain-containing protein n=1 Tax=Streptomyces cyaneochromogenes TaxID=2496836 RepID=A0A3S9M1D5_9ACTN|nr:hypothetical protein [Streptomyces cyaneochromogenes]AZQ32969.1 hypothetical protein EJ357_05480 [Streptomyces cyaneochromogenes]
MAEPLSRRSLLQAAALAAATPTASLAAPGRASAAVEAPQALVTRVRSTVNAWVSAGLLSQTDGATVVRTAEQATYAS